MACEAARRWDRKYGRSLKHHTVDEDGDTLIPISRPCDWCGRVVDKGYIHEECKKKEADLYADLAL